MQMSNLNQKNESQLQALYNQGNYVIRNLQSNHIKQTLITKIIILLLVTILGVRYYYSNKDELTKYTQLDPSHYLKIITQNQQIVHLPYLKPEIYQPLNVSEYDLNIIDIPDTKSFQQAVNSMGSDFQFAKNLYKNWFNNNQLVFQLQYYRLNSKYNLDEYVTEKGICIISPFKNLMRDGDKGSWKMFLKSINQQNYSNYRVFMIDDFSSDNSTATILKQVSNYPRLNNRILMIKNVQKIGALGNRDFTIRNYCRPGQIVMDIDGDDALIGKQVLNLFNRFYYKDNQSAWFVYTNFVSIKGQKIGSGRTSDIFIDQLNYGFSKPMEKYWQDNNTYRTQLQIWVTSQLRTYYRDLYIKIPLPHLMERGTNKYFIQSSDRFSIYCIAQMAGPNHTYFYPELNYFYYEPNYSALAKQGCTLPVLWKSEFQARLKIPLKRLTSLTDKVQLTQNYYLPLDIYFQYLKKHFIEKYCKIIFQILL